MAYSLRFLPSFQYIRNVLQENLIGDINFCEVHVQVGSVINNKKYLGDSVFA